MSEVLAWLGSLAGLSLLISRVWDVIETPVLHFILLGRVPGTAVILEFEHIVGIGFALFWVLLLLEHLSARRKAIRQHLQLVSI
jgi:hypothetical protein